MLNGWWMSKMDINPAPVTSGPYTHERSSINRTMLLVMIALTPATAFGIYQFGLPALFLFVLTIAACVISEAACLAIAGKPVKPYLMDGSAILTGWLLAMTLPPWSPWWIGVVGAMLAIIVGKQVFGGIGQNLFNPAMVARVALLIAFPLEMTSWVLPQPMFSASAPGMSEALGITFVTGTMSAHDAISSATILGHVKTELSQGLLLHDVLADNYDVFGLATGSVAGSLGETSAILILIGGLFLLYMRIISWHIPVSMLLTLAVLASLFHLASPERYPDAIFHLMSGATLLGAFFIATDLVTSPVTYRGQLVFGAGCGALVFIIRSWTGYPEGVAFAVMLMNALTPLIDHYMKPRIYGRNRKGDPIQYAEDMESPK
ncbi:MAG: RnfABCDGE type electron transport complex subunit D [Gammaproteobacteria bacterium]|jgi:electron transport complex protein RnfD